MKPYGWLMKAMDWDSDDRTRIPAKCSRARENRRDMALREGDGAPPCSCPGLGAGFYVPWCQLHGDTYARGDEPQ